MTDQEWLRSRAVTAGWLTTLPLAGAAVARLARLDGHPVLAMANAATPFLYLPAYGALAIGVAARRKALAAAAGALTLAHLAWILPEVRGRRRSAPVEGTRLRVVSANVRYHSADSSPLGRELAASEADLLLLQELSPEHRIMIKAAGAFDEFPYSYVDDRPGSFGAGIWSRWPLSNGETWEPGGLPMVRASIEVAGTRVQVFNVHPRAPMRRRWVPLWKRQMRELRDAVEACERPVIVAGDFNSTSGHEPFRKLLAAGLRDAHVEAGRGLLTTTWPRGYLFLPPLFHIDHVLVSPEIGVVDAGVGVGASSDHRPVIADLVVPPGLSEERASPPNGS